MNPFASVFFVANGLALLMAPRHWAPVPLLVSSCYMTMGQGLELGPFSLPVYRLILGVGVIRVLLRHERVAGGLNAMDVLLMVWGGWVFLASLFHEWAPGSGPIFASGLIYNVILVYFLIRAWCSSPSEVADLTRITAFILVPVALEMLFEHITRTNFFSVFGGVPTDVYVRDGMVRAQGPFQHPILAGTVGAVCFPLMIGIWRRHRWSALVGIIACLLIVLASGSSSPGMSLLMGIGALLVWRYRTWLRAAWILGAWTYLLLELYMSRPAYYVISKFDLTGSSTGWHRARLIEASIEHFGEWWLFGTDRTAHWMGISVGWSEKHSDITNYYLLIGIIGGFPALLIVIAMIWRAFRLVGAIVSSAPPRLVGDRFMIWCLGAGLFAHAGTSLSVAYFDQSVVFFWLNLAVVSSMHSAAAAERADDSVRRWPSALRRERTPESPRRRQPSASIQLPRRS